MVVGHVAHDGEPEPGAARDAAAAVVDPVETLEDPVEVAGGDADAVVLDGEPDRVALLDPPAGRRGDGLRGAGPGPGFGLSPRGRADVPVAALARPRWAGCTARGSRA